VITLSHSDDSVPPSWIVARQLTALDQLLVAFRELNVPYVATGGLAGNLHGSRWPLHDLDFDVPHDALPRLAAHFAPAVRFGPAAYRDDEFALTLLTLELHGTSIDLAAAETVRLVRADGALSAFPTDLLRGEIRSLGSMRLHTMALDDLIAYKRVLRRPRDVADLEQLARDRG
jgi:hypothetical protein